MCKFCKNKFREKFLCRNAFQYIYPVSVECLGYKLYVGTFHFCANDRVPNLNKAREKKLSDIGVNY